MIVCPLVFLGELISLPAYMIAGLPVHMATGTNKCGNAFGTLLATSRFLKKGDVHYPTAIAGSTCCIAGNYVGSGLALKGVAKVIRPMFFVVLALLLVRLIYGLFFKKSRPLGGSYDISGLK